MCTIIGFLIPYRLTRLSRAVCFGVFGFGHYCMCVVMFGWKNLFLSEPLNVVIIIICYSRCDRPLEVGHIWILQYIASVSISSFGSLTRKTFYMLSTEDIKKQARKDYTKSSSMRFMKLVIFMITCSIHMAREIYVVFSSKYIKSKSVKLVSVTVYLCFGEHKCNKYVKQFIKYTKSNTYLKVFCCQKLDHQSTVCSRLWMQLN